MLCSRPPLRPARCHSLAAHRARGHKTDPSGPWARSRRCTDNAAPRLGPPREHRKGTGKRVAASEADAVALAGHQAVLPWMLPPIRSPRSAVPPGSPEPVTGHTAPLSSGPCCPVTGSLKTVWKPRPRAGGGLKARHGGGQRRRDAPDAACTRTGASRPPLARVSARLPPAELLRAGPRSRPSLRSAADATALTLILCDVCSAHRVAPRDGSLGAFRDGSTALAHAATRARRCVASVRPAQR